MTDKSSARLKELWLKQKAKYDEKVEILSMEFPDEVFTYHMVRSACKRLPEYIERQLKASDKMKCVDKKESTPQTEEELMRAVKYLKEATQANDTKQTKATYEIEDDKPICIAFWGDWHLGAAGCDYNKFEEHRDLIANTDGLYWIGMGDYRDNYLQRMPFGTDEQTVNAEVQDFMVMKYLEDVQHNNIALIRGCHEDWSKQSAGVDLIQKMCDMTNAVHLWHGGDLFINFNGNEYHVMARHKFKYESSLNVSNATRRMLDFKGSAEVVCIAHLHNPFIMEQFYQRGYRIMMRSGSYKKEDEFGQKIGGYEGITGVPCVILYPDKKKYVGMFLDEAVMFLNALRKE